MAPELFTPEARRKYRPQRTLRTPFLCGGEFSQRPQRPQRWIFQTHFTSFKGITATGAGGSDEGSTVPSLAGRWDTFYPAVARAVRGVGDVPVAVEDAVRTATVLDAARASASSRDVISV